MTAKENTAIEVRGLTKKFGDVIAVAGIDFAVQEGELFGFLGPNGAGKSTTINMLIGLARPDTGTIHINGIDCSKSPKDAQHLMGVVPDESNLYPELTGFANLSFCGALYGMARAAREARARPDGTLRTSRCRRAQVWRLLQGHEAKTHHRRWHPSLAVHPVHG